MAQTIARFQPGVEALYGESCRPARRRNRGRSSKSTRYAGPRPACRARSPRASLRSIRCSPRSTSSRSRRATHRPVATVGGRLLRSSPRSSGFALAARAHRQAAGRQPLADACQGRDARRSGRAAAHARRATCFRTGRTGMPRRSSRSGRAPTARRWSAPRASSASCAPRPRRTSRCCRWGCASCAISLDVARPGARRDPVQRRLDSGLRWNDALDFPRLRRPAPRTLPLPRSERRGARPAAPQPCRETLHTESDSHRGSLTPRTLRPR